MSFRLETGLAVFDSKHPRRTTTHVRSDCPRVGAALSSLSPGEATGYSDGVKFSATPLMQ